MTWQEELRKLDESLASGSLSADEYRTRRDQILSSAVSSPDQQAESTGDGDSTQIVAPLSGHQAQAGQAGHQTQAGQQPPMGQQPQPSQPQPSQPQFQQAQPSQPQPSQPQFGQPQPGQQQPGQQPPGQPQPGQPQQAPQPGPEATQVVTPADQGAERTQAVQPWQGQPASPAGGFQQPQQQGYPASPPGGFAGPQQAQQPTQQGQPWNAPQGDSAPPWGGGDFPPLTPQGNADWGVSQGPESFDDKPSSPGKGRKIAFSALAAVVLAGIGVAVWLLFIADDGDPDTRAQNSGPSAGQQQSQQASTPTTTPLPSPPAAKQPPTDNESALIDPPGKERGGGGEFDSETVEDKGILPGTVVAALLDTDMGKGLLKTTVTENDTTVSLYSIEVGSESEATTVADEYEVTQQDGNIPPIRDLSLQGVPVFGAGNANDNSVYRSVYVLYDRVVILEVFGPERDKVESLFAELLTEQVEHAPPSYTGY